MIRIYTDSFVPKYGRGKWVWNEEEDCLQFDSREEAIKKADTEEFMMTSDFRIRVNINQLEEMIFIQEFARKPSKIYIDVIQLIDIKNLVMFLSPPEFMRKDLLNFINLKLVHDFVKAAVLYFDYFLKVVEYILIRRDEVSGEKGQIENDASVETRRTFSARLSQWRLLLARTYSEIIVGSGSLKYHHQKDGTKVSNTFIKDKAFYEIFFAYVTQVIWISFHRRSYGVIDMEMNRLFRSYHFKLMKKDPLKLTKTEAHMLYGKNYRIENYNRQNSPLIQELIHVAKEDLPILWIGKRKYRGTDLRILEIETLFILPGSQWPLIDECKGIWGHPKNFYNTLLKLDWQAVRAANFSETYDPYHFIKQPNLPIPKLDAEKIRKNCKTFEHYFTLKRYNEVWNPQEINKWLQRDEIIQYHKSKGMVTAVWGRCLAEVNDTSYGPSVQHIIKNFLILKQSRKKK